MEGMGNHVTLRIDGKEDTDRPNAKLRDQRLQGRRRLILRTGGGGGFGHAARAPRRGRGERRAPGLRQRRGRAQRVRRGVEGRRQRGHGGNKKRAGQRPALSRPQTARLVLLFLLGARAGSRVLCRALALRVGVAAALLLIALALVRLGGRAAGTARALVALRGVASALRARAAGGAAGRTGARPRPTSRRTCPMSRSWRSRCGGRRGAHRSRRGPCPCCGPSPSPCLWHPGFCPRSRPMGRPAALTLLGCVLALLRGVLVLAAGLLRVGGLVVVADGLAALVAGADLRVGLHVRRDVRRHGGVTGLRCSRRRFARTQSG